MKFLKKVAKEVNGWSDKKKNSALHLFGEKINEKTHKINRS